MKTWTIFAAGSAAGVLVAAGLMAGAAQGETNSQASVAALEARIAELELRVASRGETLYVSAPKNMSLSAGKAMSVTAVEPMTITTAKGLDVTGKIVTVTGMDEINLVSGKARIRMRKSGQVDISGSVININGDNDVQIRGNKVMAN